MFLSAIKTQEYDVITDPEVEPVPQYISRDELLYQQGGFEMMVTTNPALSMPLKEWFLIYGWITYLFIFTMGIIIGYFLNELVNWVLKKYTAWRASGSRIS